MEIQTINLLANTPQTFMIPGKFLEIIEAPYPVSIAFFDGDGNTFADGGLVNAESGLYVDLRDGKGWGSITVTSTTAQQIKLLVGSMMGGSRRQPGVVQVIDGARTRTFAGVPFSGYAGIGPQGAGLYGKVQLWNPAASGRNLLVYRVEPYSTVASVIVAVRETIALATLVTKANSHDLSLGDGTSMAEVRTAAPAVQGVGSGARRVFNIRAATPEVILFAHPILIRPGNGFTIHSNVPANSDLAATFEFLEEPI